MRGRLTIVLLMLAVVGAEAQAQAQVAPSTLTPLAVRAVDINVACCTPPTGWQQVGAGALAAMRGGFTTAGGLSLSLGIERLVSINGEVVARTTFQIGNVGMISGDEARHARDAINSFTLVQNGPNNFAAGDPLSAARGTFVQNSLNGQTISTQTIISSSVNSMSLLKDLNFQTGLRDAAIQGIGTH